MKCGKGRWPRGGGGLEGEWGVGILFVIPLCSFLLFNFFFLWLVCVAFFVPDERLLKYNAKQLKKYNKTSVFWIQIMQYQTCIDKMTTSYCMKPCKMKAPNCDLMSVAHVVCYIFPWKI